MQAHFCIILNLSDFFLWALLVQVFQVGFTKPSKLHKAILNCLFQPDEWHWFMRRRAFMRF